MKNLRKIVPETVIMGLSYLVILIAMIVAVSLSGWATAGSGLSIPNCWLWVPAVLFIVLSLCQAIVFFARKGKAGYEQVALSAVKLLVVFAVEYIIDFGWNSVWESVTQGDSVYFAMVIVFLVALFAAVGAEIFGNFRLRKKADAAR